MHRPILGALALVTTLALVGCGSGTGDEPQDTKTPAKDPGEPLSLAMVQEIVPGTRFAEATKDCKVGLWSENSTGVAGEQAKDVTAFRQFDCYPSKKSAQSSYGIPQLIQVIKVAEFKTPESAAAYADTESGFADVVQSDTTVVVMSSAAPEEMAKVKQDLLDGCSDCESKEAQ